ncbi:glycosyl hydrolase [Kineosporia mesophila]|uniref:Glycosyl hydrolase n=1 Tax=Kineosporia mesophila TaxID=566012 RepID=A0ABP6ZVP3_9ACTN|nr:hypothetical protein [Kineosporia mesophila]MCD5348574.1 hypothetical protein [Kineosporia mesophila]
MSGKHQRRFVASAASAVLAGGVLAAVIGGGGAANAAGNTCGVLFDDFSYSSATDTKFTANGWTARGNAGGPGVPGATWKASNITFPTVDGQKVAQLESSTDGTSSGTVQSEFLTAERKFKNGTYAARIKFHDSPVSGTDGDHVNETFFAIGPAQNQTFDPTYSELDFSEYLPNGGWGEQGPINYQTSWNGYQDDPWVAHNAHDQQRTSIDGWHDVMATVTGSQVKYYIDGTLVGDQSYDDATGTFPVWPRANMSVNFNLWFIDTAAHTSGNSVYQEQVDWFFHSKDTELTPAQVAGATAGYRSAGKAFEDTVGTGPCSTTPPVTTPPTTPPVTPTTTATPGNPANCNQAAAWEWSKVYLEGSKVKHGNHLWQANWWTQGSEPGLTAQWKDLGPC